MTLRSYVERQNWALRRTTVELWHETRPAADGKSMTDHFIAPFISMVTSPKNRD